MLFAGTGLGNSPMLQLYLNEPQIEPQTDRAAHVRVPGLSCPLVDVIPLRWERDGNTRKSMTDTIAFTINTPFICHRPWAQSRRPRSRFFLQRPTIRVMRRDAITAAFT